MQVAARVRLQKRWAANQIAVAQCFAHALAKFGIIGTGQKALCFWRSARRIIRHVLVPSSKPVIFVARSLKASATALCGASMTTGTPLSAAA